jgi:hypothetical protein
VGLLDKAGVCTQGDGRLRQYALLQCDHVTSLIQREVACVGAGCGLRACQE